MKILITGGPTWAKIDDVRIVTNIFTGKTALYLAKKFTKRKNNVTLFMNLHCIDKFPKNIRVIPFKYFDELKAKLKMELKKDRYDLIIHTAAVSDYKLKKAFKGKVASKKKEWKLILVPTPKLIKIIRKLARESFLVQFKLEVEKKNLIDKAFRSLKENKADLVVANSLEELRLGYKAYVIDKNKNIKEISSKEQLSRHLLQLTHSSK
jgi:phosphopantothenoylcysteine decarboxylase/phosphopantothenate--cysteine ligase